MKKAIIVIPAYNEEKRIGRTLEEYSSCFESLRKSEVLDYEILVSINNTTDDTEKIVKSFSRKNKRIRYINLPEGGKGYAVIEGFKDALTRNSDLIGFVDADMATSPQSYYELIQQIDNYDAIIASRYIKGAKVYPKQTFARILSSRIYNILIRALFLLPYRDTQCGAKVFKAECIRKILPELTMSKWAFDLDLLYNLMKFGARIKENPTVWSDKEYSKINFLKAGPRMALSVIRLRIINSPFRFMVRLYNKLPDFLKFKH